MKKKYVVIAVPIILILIILTIIFLPPTIKLKNEKAEVGSKYIPKYTVNRFGIDYTKKSKMKNHVKTKKLGEYKIEYKTKIGPITFKQKKIVKVVDETKPKITLNGEKETYYCPNTKYKDEGATAKDNYDGDLTKKIKTKKEKDKITYTVEDSSKNKRVKVRKLKEGDIKSPELTLNGEDTIQVYAGDNFNDPGIKAIDNCDGDLTTKVVTSGAVDTSKLGIYTLTYSVIDNKNNKAEKQRNIKVVSRPSTNGTGKAGTIYLTFDDGPLEGTTNVILDTLKAEGVKATFFVTNNGPDYLIKREYDEGHTVALHTATHNYAILYSSDEAYYQDLNAVQERVKRITGYTSQIIRFPGGASNTVSRKYSNGIMSRLTQSVTSKGYHYFDWNISSGDAGGTTTASGVYSNVINNLRKDRANIVLMHDIKTYTRDAIKNIITYGKQNGYSFEKITMETEEYHQKVNN